MARIYLSEAPGGDDYPDGYWENRREHAEVKPRYKRTKQDEEYWAKKNKQNEDAARELNRSKNVVMNALEKQANSTPFTGEQYKEATDNQRQRHLNKWHDYRNGIRAAATLGELALSGGTLLGAYANYKRWKDLATLANATRIQIAKARIANLLQEAQAPIQVGSTLIDAYQSFDAATQGNKAETYYNVGSAGLSSLGYVGAQDFFRGRYPKVDRFLDVMGILQAAGDYVKFGYDSYNGFNNK